MVIVVVAILLFLTSSMFFMFKSLNDFMKAEETIKKETWEEEKNVGYRFSKNPPLYITK